MEENNFFDSLKGYTSEWNETESRKFNEKECAAVTSADVVPSKYGMSVRFYFGKVQKFIPLEPSTTVASGEVLDVHNMTLVHLHYNGIDPAVTVRDIYRIRYAKEENPISFDNPFGI